MPYFFGFLTLSLVVLIIDIAAITDLTTGVEPNYVLEIGFLVFSFFFFLAGGFFYLNKWVQKKNEPKGPRF